MSDDILTLSDATFDETVAGADTPVVVDFWAEWCGPCKMIAPALEEIASEQEGKLAIAKLNVDDNPDTARRFDVMSIPTLLVFKDGQQVKRLVGAKGKGQLLQDLAEFIGLSDTGRARGRAARRARRVARPAGPPRRRWAHEIPPAEAGGYGAGAPRPRCARSRRRAGCGSTASAGPRPGRRWSRAGTASATACSTAAGPMLRGDDVAELQRRLNGLGFDAGREDGILGDDTTRALLEFQRNMNLPTDGMCGPATLAVLDRVGGARRRLGRRGARAGDAAPRSAPARGPAGVRRRRARVRDARATLVVRGLRRAGRGRRARRHRRRRSGAGRRGQPLRRRPLPRVPGRRRARLSLQLLRVGALPVRGGLTRSPTRCSRGAGADPRRASPAPPAAPTRSCARPAWPR